MKRLGLIVIFVAVAAHAQQPPCPPPPQFIAISFEGQESGCTAVNQSACKQHETIQFNVTAFQGTFADCDTFLWNFDDGTVSANRAPAHAFGPGKAVYHVTLRVMNPFGESNASTNVRVMEATTVPTIASFSVTPSKVRAGNSVTFRWVARNVTMVRLDPLGLEFSNDTTSYEYTPLKSQRFTLTGYLGSTTTVKTVDVEVDYPRRRAVRH